MAKIAIVGGSGFYSAEDLELGDLVEVSTPYGEPSAPLQMARFQGIDLVFLPRHGAGHRFNPTNVPYRANIYALKSVGVTHILAASAVGSLKEEIEPIHLVVPDQIIDRTKSRDNTFFDPIAVHAGFADPFCAEVRKICVEEARKLGLTVHDGGTYVCMEGPLFSTRAESALYRSWGASVIGMTALPEAKLAREAEIPYAIVAQVTDYDVWHEEMVSVEVVLGRLQKNFANVKELTKNVVPRVAQLGECDCQKALENAVLSTPASIPPDKKEAFSLLLGKYIDL